MGVRTCACPRRDLVEEFWDSSRGCLFPCFCFLCVPVPPCLASARRNKAKVDSLLAFEFLRLLLCLVCSVSFFGMAVNTPFGPLGVCELIPFLFHTMLHSCIGCCVAVFLLCSFPAFLLCLFPSLHCFRPVLLRVHAKKAKKEEVLILLRLFPLLIYF